MEEKIESENSCSSESTSSSSSSGSSSASSEYDEEVTEPVRILGQTLELPQELCEDYSIFKEFFSMKTWESLDDKHKEHLKELLPTFPENDEEEKDTTIKMLFNFEPLHFKSPMNQFFTNLRQGNYRPDIARMRKFLTKARAKQQRHKTKAYYAKMLPEVLISRERLLASAKSAPPGPIPFLPALAPKPSSKNSYKPIYVRARQRYFEELSAIWSEVGADESEDENYPEGPPENAFKKRKTMHGGQGGDANVSGTLGMGDPSHPASLDCLKNVLATHRARRQYRENHPELSTAGITLEDIKQRVALLNGAKKLMFGGQKAEIPIPKLKKAAKKDTSKQRQDGKPPAKKIKEEPDSIENKPLLPNIKIKCEKEDSDSESSSFLDPVSSPKHGKKLMDVDIKQEVPDTRYQNANCHENDLEKVIKQEPLDPGFALQNSSRMCQPVPIKLEDLDGIDMMALPVELADDSGEVVPADTSTETEDNHLETDEALTETTHANFLSLVRALFPARTAHRASKQQLHARCAAVMRSPIAPLNTWYNLSDDWCGELNSALDFLAGERGPHPDDYVPYLQYMSETQVYQWIGAGRDCDAILGRLCERWLRAASPPPPPSEPPPPRYPTSWIVRQPTSTEITEFRTQERKRFASASKPFTYMQYGYRSVVGPATGQRAGAGGAAGGAGAALLAQQRPRAAAFLALLRDALARMPNGEGTKRDIVTLLKMSQWIVPCSEQALSVAVATALERLVAVKRDPIVKYDQRTAVWTYLHRHKSEEDWAKSAPARGRANKANTPALQLHSPQTPMEVDGPSIEEIHENASDSDVDVDDSGAAPSAPHLSSAQLLMQATQSNTPKQTPANKQKGKLVPTTPKVKTITTKQNVKMPSLVQTKQTTKQSNPTIKTNQANSIPKQSNTTPKQSNTTPKTTPKTNQNQKQSAQTNPKQTSLLTPAKSMPNLTKQNTPKQTQKQAVKQSTPSPKQKQIVVQNVKQNAPLTKQNSDSMLQTPCTLPAVVVAPQRSPLMKQKSLKIEPSQAPVTLNVPVQQPPSVSTAAPPNVNVVSIQHNTINQSAKLSQVTRSLLIRPPSGQTATTAPTITVCTSTTQVTPSARRGVVRVLSPAAPSSGKSLISPRALMQQSTPPTTKKRPSVPGTTSVMTVAQSTTSTTNVVSSIPTAVTSSVTTRTVQLAGGRTVQLAANQTVHLPSGQAVQLSSGHTLQLSSLQLPTHSVRLPSGQTVQLASPQTMQQVRVSTTQVRNPSPRLQTTTPTIKPNNQQVQIPVSTVQLAGQTVQIAGQTVQLSGQSMQLTGHTVKLPSGQSVQVASQSVLPQQSVQLPSGQTVQLASGTVQLGQNVQLSGQTVQIPSGQNVQLGGQTVQIGGQTVQLAGGQTVQLPSGQTLQLPSGQTVQLSSGQTLQLANGQTLQLANQTPKSIAQVVRTQTAGDKNSPIVAKLLTNAQTQMISLESMMGGAGGAAARARGVRVLAPASRLARPLLLTSAKPLHNIILQQSDGTAIRVTSAGGTPTSQTIVLSNMGGQTVTTSSTTAPVLKLQQVNPLHQVKLPQGIKIQQATTSSPGATPAGVRSVLMDGQQLKLVSGRHVLARLLKPAHPTP